MFRNLHPKQRAKIADMFLDLSKIFFASLVIGPFISSSQNQVIVLLVIIGVMCFIITSAMGIILSRPEEG
ncbi:MAG: hypothetical protein HYT76_04770 [Deltaproteobacteria bacterium]|nr:hypothetical protein [Deltaproteobacteria bacterium]